MMEQLINKFRKSDGEIIPDLIEYISGYLKNNPNITISVGCDSSVKSNSILYAVTIMIYDHNITKGAHVIHYKTSIKGRLDNFTRLYTEAELIHEVCEYIHANLDHKRQDITDDLIRRYKLHLEQHDGMNLDLEGYDEVIALNTINVTEKDRLMEYKLCDIHLDYNLMVTINHIRSLSQQCLG